MGGRVRWADVCDGLSGARRGARGADGANRAAAHPTLHTRTRSRCTVNLRLVCGREKTSSPSAVGSEGYQLPFVSEGGSVMQHRRRGQPSASSARAVERYRRRGRLGCKGTQVCRGGGGLPAVDAPLCAVAWAADEG